MKYLSLAANWLILSSADETKFSATLKGSLVFTVLTMLAPLVHINGSADLLNQSVTFIIEAGKFLGAIYALFGVIRKVHHTVMGSNAVLNHLG